MDLWAWMERLGQDDHEALEHLLAHYDGMLRYIISGMLSDPKDQEDCLAQVCAKLWEGRHQYDREKASPTTWLTALCRNTAYDHLRAQQRRGFPEELDPRRPDPTPGPEEKVLQKERVQHLQEAVDKLSARDRALFYRKYYYLQSTASPPSWAPQNGQWRESSTASANACKPC
jgi:RNA polymerase sigma factor (sigma-70 family)